MPDRINTKEFSVDNPFTLNTPITDIASYFNAINTQYGSLLNFCKLTRLPKSFYYKMYRASSCVPTITSIYTLNESLKYYHKDVQIKTLAKEEAIELFKSITRKYNSILQFCESNNMMHEYQKIVGFTSNRRKKLPRKLKEKINSILSKDNGTKN